MTWLFAWLSPSSIVPKTGDPAPDFELPDHDGRLRASREFHGKWLVLYFFPRADTPAWTEQAARFRDAIREFEDLGAIVCGVSVDHSVRLAQFAARYRLPFVLLSDRDGAVAAKYGSLINLGLLKFARRNTFLIDPGGRITKRYLGVQPSQNAVEVIADLRLVKAGNE